MNRNRAIGKALSTAFVCSALAGGGLAFAQAVEENGMTQPAAGVKVDKAVKPKSPSTHAVLMSARTALSRAIIEKDLERREGKLNALVDFVTKWIDRTEDDDEFRWELFGILIDVQHKLGDSDAVYATIRQQQQDVMDVIGAGGCQKWLSDEVARRWNRRDFDIAIRHLEESIPARADDEMAARNALMIGDILVQKAYPDGPFDAAIEYYARVAQTFAREFPDLADDAKLRQAKTLWRAGQQAAAEAITTKLQESRSENTVENARHFARFMATMVAADMR